MFLGTYFVAWFCVFQDLLEYFFLKRNMVFCALFLLIFAVKFSFLRSIESIFVLKKCPACAEILFFCPIFWRYKHVIYFALSSSFVSRQPPVSSYFLWYISLFNIFWGTYFVWWFRLFQELLVYIFLKECGFSALFLHIFVVKISFWKSVESSCVVRKWPSSAGILFFCLIFWRYKHIS